METGTNKNYDLNLGKWGPYNKEYLGVCHIADEKLGATFSVELFPGFFRRTVMVSPAVNDNGAKMWGANPALTRFCYRYELEWKDRVYCDADFTITDDKGCDIKCTFVNNTNMHQSVNMNLCLSMKLPLSSKALYTPVSGTKCKIIDAVWNMITFIVRRRLLRKDDIWAKKLWMVQQAWVLLYPAIVFLIRAIF